MKHNYRAKYPYFNAFDLSAMPCQAACLALATEGVSVIIALMFSYSSILICCSKAEKKVALSLDATALTDNRDFCEPHGSLFM